MLSVDDLILEPAAYLAVRPERRAEAITRRRDRRVQLGDVVVLEFENDDTLRYQAQEMLYVERVTDPSAAAAEISVYERLRPTGQSLTATMLIEIDDPAQVRGSLAKLDGIHEAVRLEIGDHRIPARDIPPPEEGPSAHTVSVHFLRFDLPEAAVAALRGSAATRLVVEHPAYNAAAELRPDQLTLLSEDLHEPTTHQ